MYIIIWRVAYLFFYAYWIYIASLSTSPLHSYPSFLSVIVNHIIIIMIMIIRNALYVYTLWFPAFWFKSQVPSVCVPVTVTTFSHRGIEPPLRPRNRSKTEFIFFFPYLYCFLFRRSYNKSVRRVNDRGRYTHTRLTDEIDTIRRNSTSYDSYTCY